jgi:hypothetical protein
MQKFLTFVGGGGRVRRKKEDNPKQFIFCSKTWSAILIFNLVYI